MLKRLPEMSLYFGLVLVMACARGEEQAAGEAMEESSASMQTGLPDTTATAVWTYLQSADYRANWRLWPGKGQLYTGRDPHGALLTTYANEAAHAAVTNKSGSMPAGAIIVKENFMPDSSLAAITVMYKVDGYDPGNQNWFWAKLGPDGAAEVAGRGQGCIACHGAQRANDFIFTSSLQ